jgi:hypothetical protein
MCDASPSLCRKDASMAVRRSRCCCATGVAYTRSVSRKEGETMLVFFSGRRLKPGSWEQFRRAWEPGDGDLPDTTVGIYHARNVKDPDEVISFGIFDIDRDHDAMSSVRGEEQAELARQDAMAAFVKNVPLEGVYEVIEEIKP